MPYSHSSFIGFSAYLQVCKYFIRIASFSILLAPLPVYSSQPHLTAENLAVIVNSADPLSVRIADYYTSQRNIPTENIIYVNFPTGYNTLPVKKFKHIKTEIDQATGDHIQAYALTWTFPYKVGCMSITTAIAAGYDEAYCAKGCAPTKPSPYFNSDTSTPYNKHHLRPSMMLAGENFYQVKTLIDRGIASDFSRPAVNAFLLTTRDKNRSVRSTLYPSIKNAFPNTPTLHFLTQDYIQNKENILFYFTGLKHVEFIDSNTYTPGAIADHLTSAGGRLAGDKQMNILQWIKAGVTGSYGTVVEPCNFLQKFPHPGIIMHFYLRGNTLIEAYWKSVAWPGQGLFIGEPLAKPFATRNRP